VHSKTVRDLVKRLSGIYRNRCPVNLKPAVYRIYRELELNLRIKPRRRLKREKPEEMAVPDAPNVVWSMDFMADRLLDGRQFRLRCAT